VSYTLDDGRTLKNLLGAKNGGELDRLVAEVVAPRMMEISEGLGPERTFDVDHLKALHKHLFQDAFEWAGHFRNEKFELSDGTIAHEPSFRKIGGANVFAVGNQIPLELKALMSQLKENDYLRGLDRAEFVSEAAHFLGRLNGIHAFREGNGRTQRQFMTALAAEAGHKIDFSVISAERMTVASVAANEHGDMGPMLRMFAEITDPKRVKALQSVIQVFEKYEPRKEPHVSSWDHYYIATSEPGQKYTGTFAGTDGVTFMLQPDSSTIVVGNAVDLPSPRPEIGRSLSFTAGDRRDLAIEAVVLVATGPREEKFAEPQTAAELARAPLIPARELPDLTAAEIASQLAGSERLVSIRSEVEQLSEIVYGQPGAMAKDVVRIDADPATGRAAGAAAAERVRSDAAERTLLAGEAGTWLRKESPARQEAVAHAPRLADAIENYGGMAEFLRHKLMEQHQEEQKRHRQEVPAPSAELSAVLRAPAVEQAARLSGNDPLSSELKQLTRTFTQRLAPDDYRAIRTGDDAVLAGSLNISIDAARTVAGVHKQVSEANRVVQAQARVMDQSRGAPVLKM